MLHKADGTPVYPGLLTENSKPTATTSRQQLINQAKLRSSKLSGTRSHLQTLIQKKLRIEIEIKGVLKALQKMQKLQRKTLTESFGLDPQDPDLDQKIQQILDQDAELREAIQEGDDTIRKIAVNLEDAEFLIRPDVDKLNKLL